MEDQPSYLVDFYSIVHVADRSYYEELERRCSDYDYVLFELITSKNNLLVEENGLTRLKTPVFSPQTDTLGETIDLCSYSEKLKYL